MKYIFGKKHKDSDFDALFNFAFKSSTLRSAALRLLILLLIDFSKQATEWCRYWCGKLHSFLGNGMHEAQNIGVKA